MGVGGNEFKTTNCKGMGPSVVPKGTNILSSMRYLLLLLRYFTFLDCSKCSHSWLFDYCTS